jgi:hypothetical protein
MPPQPAQTPWLTLKRRKTWLMQPQSAVHTARRRFSLQRRSVASAARCCDYTQGYVSPTWNNAVGKFFGVLDKNNDKYLNNQLPF